MLRYMTAGESHGKGMLAILDGVPAGLKMDEEFINNELLKRMHGYGRGGRMAIEKTPLMSCPGAVTASLSAALSGLWSKMRTIRSTNCPG